MQIFKNYSKIIYKNKISILLLIIIFALLLNITNYSTTKDLNMQFPIEVVDNAKNEDSKNLIAFLNEKYKVNVGNLTTDEAKDLLFGSMTSYVLFIDENNNLSYFSKEDSTDPVVINMAINEYLSTNRTLNQFNIENTHDNTVDILTENADFEILSSSDLTATEGYYIYLTYIILAIILSVIFLAYHSFLKDGVQNRVKISKTKIGKFNLSLYFSSIVFVIILCVGLSLFEFFKNKSDITQLPLFLLNLIVFAIPIIILAYLISSMSKNVKSNGSLNNIISLVLCFISGVFVPQEYLPDYLLKLSSIFPPYWYMRGLKSVGKSDYETLFQVFIVQLIITVVLILVNLLVNKSKKADFSYSR